MLGGGRDASVLQGLGEGDRGGRDRGGARAEAAFGLLGVAAGPGDVEHRRQVDVDADVAQVGRGARRPGRRLKAAPRAPICSAEAVGAPSIRFTRPPSWSIITSSGSRSPGGRRIACRRATTRRAARTGGEVLVEEDDAGDAAHRGSSP